MAAAREVAMGGGTTDRGHGEEAPLTPPMRALLARVRRVSLVFVVFAGLVLAGFAGATLALLLRPGLVGDQGMATIAAGLGTLISAATLGPLAIGRIRALRRYDALQTYRTATGPLRLEAATLPQLLVQFDSTLSGTVSEYLVADGRRLPIPRGASEAIASLPPLPWGVSGYDAAVPQRLGTVVYIGDDLLLEVSDPEGRVVYRRRGSEQ